MWGAESNMNQAQQQTIVNSECEIETGYGDSGFLSGSNLISAEHLSYSRLEPSEVIIDSGFDITHELSRMGLSGINLASLERPPTYDETMNMISTAAYEEETRQRLIKQYTNRDEDGDTILHSSIICRYYTQMLRLILNAPDPAVLSTVNKDGHTPLHLAVLAKQSGLVRILVLSGANLTARSREGNTPLHLACRDKSQDCASALLDPVSVVEQAYHMKVNKRFTAIPQDLEIKNYIGQTCVHVATEIGSISILRLLLRMGADLEAREGLCGNTALMIAIWQHKQELIDFFLTECRPNFETENYAGITAYQMALSVGNYALAKRLISLGAIPEPLPEDSYCSSDEEMDSDEDRGHSSLNNSLDNSTINNSCRDFVGTFCERVSTEV